MEKTEITELLEGLGTMQSFIEGSILEDTCYEGELDDILQLIKRLQEKLVGVTSLEAFSEPEKEAIEKDMDALSNYVCTLNSMLNEPEEELDLSRHSSLSNG